MSNPAPSDTATTNASLNQADSKASKSTALVPPALHETVTETTQHDDNRLTNLSKNLTSTSKSTTPSMSTQEANPTNATSHNSVEGNSEVNASQNPTNDNQSERQVFPIEDTSPILPLSLGHPPNSPSSMPPPLYSSTAAHTTPLPQPQIQIQIPPNLDLPLPPSTSTTTTTTTTNTSAPQLPLPSITATNPPPNTTNLPSPVKSDPDPIAVMATDSKTSLPAFSYDDLETQFWKKVEEMEKKEGELRQEFEAWVEIFKAWGTSGARVDGERGAKRLRTRTAFVQNRESKVEDRRAHLMKVISAFESALALMRD